LKHTKKNSISSSTFAANSPLSFQTRLKSGVNNKYNLQILQINTIIVLYMKNLCE